MTGTQGSRSTRPSTRSTRSTRQVRQAVPTSGASMARSKGSTRPAKNQTRKRAPEKKESLIFKKREKVASDPSLNHTDHITEDHDEPRRRSQLYGEERAMKRKTRPVQTIAMLFVAVIVIVTAFGLLRSGSESMVQPVDTDTSNDNEAGIQVYYKDKGTTSTNTSILRRP